MNRRDTIIIAVLVNAALLMILFATASHPGKHTEKPHTREIVQHASPPSRPSAPPPVATSAPPVKANPKASIDLLGEFIIPTLADANSQEDLFTFDETELAFVQTPPSLHTAPTSPPLSNSSPQTVSPDMPLKRGQDLPSVQLMVKKGDFLEKIAKANNTTVSAIMQANHLTSTQLKVGQLLKIPLSEGESARTEEKRGASPKSLTEGEFYIVKEGDNPWLIATRNKIPLEELLRLNGLDDQKAKHLRPGDKLRIR